MLSLNFLGGGVSMSESDLKINSKARKTLVEANLDLSVLSVSTTSGAVSIRGEIRKFSGAKMNPSAMIKMLSAIETNLLRAKGVKRVTFSIDNWKKKKGKWVASEESE
jgi:hypothetical protein